MPFSKKPIVELSLLGLILLLAAWLRLHRLDQIEFLWDQAEISKWAIKMARQREITWIGPLSSTKLDTFPGVVWVLAIPYAISLSPIFVTGFIALLNILTVLGGYFLARRWFGRAAALVATLVFAVSPWAVIYSRKIWHTELLAPFALVYVFTGWRAFVKGERWALFAHGVCLAFLVQIHFSALAFVPLTALWALLFWRRLEWRLVPLAVLLAAVTFIPYFLFDAQHDWRNVQRFTEMMGQPSSVDADALHATWIIATGLELHWLTGPDRYAQFAADTPNLRWLFTLEGLLVLTAGLLALGLVVRRARRSKGATSLPDEEAALLMLVTWVAMVILFQTRHSVPVAPHYLTTVFPAPFILVGWLVARTWRHFKRFGAVVQALPLILMGCIALAQVYEITALLRFVRTHDTLRGYGTPISYTVQAVDTAKRLSHELGDVEVILLSEGDEPRMYEMPAVADVLLYNFPHRAMDIRNTVILSAGPAVYWSTYEMTPGEAMLSNYAMELPDEEILLREGIRSYRFYRWSGGAPENSEWQPLDRPRLWANGVELIGYRVAGETRPGGSLHWTLVWRPTRTPTEDTYYHWFNHLTDEQGQFQGQKDGPSVLPAYWRAGDTVLNWFDVSIPPDAPPGDYMIRVGMYVYPDLENVPVLDDAGNQPNGEWMEIGPVTIAP